MKSQNLHRGGYFLYMNISTWLWQTGRSHPEAPALLTGSTLDASYRDLAQRSAALSVGLSEAFGVTPGDRVAIFAKNRTDYLVALYAVLWGGAAVVPINAKLHPAEAVWILENSGAKLVITDDGELGRQVALPCPELAFDSAQFRTLAGGERSGPPVDRAADDLAWLFYTSGTTGRPKGVMITHGNIQAMATTYCLDVDSVEPKDCALYAAPMSHGAGLYNFQFVRAGARHVVPVSRGFDAAEIMALAPNLGGVSFFAAPTMVKRLIDAAKPAGYSGEGIKTIVYGGGPMYGADIDAALEQFGPRFVQIYGQGESPMTITVLPRAIVADRAHPNWQARRASVGFAQACVTVRVVGPDAKNLLAGEPGEILVAGPTVMKGYWNNPQATVDTLADGWLHTGDIGKLDADGFLTLTDRSKDVIISGGTNIYPREVEEVLLEHPAVREVAVVGEPHADWGEQVVAFVVLESEADAAELGRFAGEHIARFKHPKRYVFIESLPINNYGKVLKTELRKMIQESNAATSG